MGSVQVTERLEREILNRVRRLTEGMWRAHEAEFPVAPKTLHAYCIREIEKEIRIITVAIGDAFNRSAWIGYHMQIPGNGNIEFRLNSKTLLIVKQANSLLIGNRAVFSKDMEAWLVKARNIMALNNITLSMVESLLNICSTGGQVRFMWPDVVNFMPDYIQQRLGNTVARSLPKDVPDFRTVRHRTTVSEWLAHCVMVSHDEVPLPFDVLNISMNIGHNGAKKLLGLK